VAFSPIDRIQIQIAIEGYPALSGMLVRHFAPRTCDSILGILPSDSRAYLWKDSMVYFELPVSMGPEKARKFFKRGELLYWPLKDSVCVAIADGVPFSQVNQIGSVLGMLPPLGEVKAGTRMRVSKL
jgi:hypothetical protein